MITDTALRSGQIDPGEPVYQVGTMLAGQSTWSPSPSPAVRSSPPEIPMSRPQTATRILVVDDDPDVVRLVVRRLQHANYKAHGLHSAADAMAFVAEKGTPDIVILDVDMPTMDGFALLTCLREQTGSPDLPAIFLSGRMRPAEIAAGRQLGAVYLTKPFIGNALLSAIDGIVEAASRLTAAPDEW